MNKTFTAKGTGNDPGLSADINLYRQISILSHSGNLCLFDATFYSDFSVYLYVKCSCYLHHFCVLHNVVIIHCGMVGQ